MFPIWFKYFRFLFHALRYPNSLEKDENIILGISFSFIMMVAFNSFVQHRYLYPVIGLILLVAYIPIAVRTKTSNKRINAKLVAPDILQNVEAYID